MWLLIIVFAPVILVAGEPVNRYVMRRVRWAPSRLPLHVFLLFSAMRNPLWIALTAPGRWVGDRFRRPPSPLTGS